MSASLSELIAGADRAQAEGRLDQAEAIARQVLLIDPSEPRATLILGVICTKKRKNEEAEVLLRQALVVDPTSFHAQLYLAIALRQQRRLEAAIEVALLAASQKADDPAAQHQLGLCCMEMRRFEEAERAFRRAAKLDPRAATLVELHGQSLLALDRPDEAIVEFRRASSLDPSNEKILHLLGTTLIERFDGQEAAQCARRILEINPASSKARLLLARALVADQKGEEALTCARELMRETPESALAAFTVGQISLGIGRIEEARAFFRSSIAIAPEQGSAYAALAQSQRIGPDDFEFIRMMESLIEKKTLHPQEAARLHFALGKSYDDLGQYESAMQHFDAANQIEYALKFGHRPFDRTAEIRSTDQKVRTMDSAFLARHISAGLDDEMPIFVVGMMRSGTTLIDQILSSHPQIGSAGEERFWQANFATALNLGEASLDGTRLRDLTRQYLSSLVKRGEGKDRVVDKMPSNYSILGLLHVALPNAKIVHLKRHPVDTCISIYATPNSSKVEWANDKENISFYYREYMRLMDHWRRVLPHGAMLEVDYEELVRDRERVTRQIVEFCGMEWSELCMRPEQNERTVSTPSVWQVRQPVYTSSLERWRNYEPWLGAFRDLL